MDGERDGEKEGEIEGGREEGRGERVYEIERFSFPPPHISF